MTSLSPPPPDDPSRDRPAQPKKSLASQLAIAGGVCLILGFVTCAMAFSSTTTAFGFLALGLLALGPLLLLASIVVAIGGAVDRQLKK